MKILLDMNLSPTWEGCLHRAGHQVVHWSSVGPAEALDAEIIAWARANQSVVFTHDLDYSALLYLTGVQNPSVVQLRSEDIRPERMEKIVIQALSQAASDLQCGALVTIEPHRFRIRSLPFEKPSSCSQE